MMERLFSWSGKPVPDDDVSSPVITKPDRDRGEYPVSVVLCVWLAAVVLAALLTAPTGDPVTVFGSIAVVNCLVIAFNAVWAAVWVSRP